MHPLEDAAGGGGGVAAVAVLVVGRLIAMLPQGVPVPERRGHTSATLAERRMVLDTAEIAVW